MSFTPRALLTAAFAALLALIAAVWPAGVWLVALFLVALIALGWGSLLNLPDPTSAAIVIGAAGAAFVVIARLATRTMAPLLIVLTIAISLMLAFASQMPRNPRPRLVETVAGIISGVLVQLGLVAWVTAVQFPSPWQSNLGTAWWGARIALPFAIVLAGCAIFGIALAQNWPGNPHRARALWHRTAPAPVVVVVQAPAESPDGTPSQVDLEAIAAQYAQQVQAPTDGLTRLLANLAAAAAIVSVWGGAAFGVTRLLVRYAVGY